MKTQKHCCAVQRDGVGLVQWGISKWLNREGLSIHKGLVARRQKGLSEEVALSLFVSGKIYLRAPRNIFVPARNIFVPAAK